MNEVLQTVLDYVKTPQTDYALLITGPWGCGKTYFWKNVVAPKLRALRPPHKPKRLLYASLYGVSDTKQIDRTLFAQSYPGIAHKAVGRISKLVGIVIEALGYADLAKIDLRSLLRARDSVVCFDDLERCKLTVETALGYINGFVEHDRAKTLILCNEKEIPKDKLEAYRAMKEKVVGSSHTFTAECEEALRSLIREYREDTAFFAFLEQHRDLLEDLFRRSETDNIRSLRRALGALHIVFEALKKGGVDANAVATQVIYAVATTAFELHAGRADAYTLRGIHSLKMVAVAGATLRDVHEEESYERDFVERYLPEVGWHRVVGCPPICEFLLTGFLDRLALLAWASELISPPDEREERIKRLSFDPREIEDEEFAKTAAQVLNEVEAGEIAAVDSYVGLYGQFEWFAEMGLIAMTQQEVLGKFTDGLSKAQEAGRLEPNPLLKHTIDHPVMAPRTEEGRTLRQHVLDANEKALGRGARERVKAAATSLKDDPSIFINAIMDDGESGLLFTPVFQELDGGDTAARILSLPNRLKSRFGMAMHVRYEKHTPSAEFAAELPVLKQIRDAMKNHREAREGGGARISMSLFIVQELVEVLDRAIGRIEQLQQAAEAATKKQVQDGPGAASSA